MRVRRFLLSAAFLFPFAAVHPLSATGSVHSRTAHPMQTAARPLTREEQAAQIVDRLTFGPTPGLVQAVAVEGWSRWLDQQLDPATLDDSGLAARLTQYPALGMSSPELAARFPDGQRIRRMAEGKEDLAADPLLAAVEQVQLARYAEKRADVRDSNKVTDAGERAKSTGQEGEAKSRAALLAGPILALPAPARLPAVLALPVPDRAALTGGLPGPLEAALLAGVAPRDRERWESMGRRAAVGIPASELEQSKVLRAVLSNRQIKEVMTDFWLNHFNIDLKKSPYEVYYAAQYEDAIRAHALGKFSDLLLATAQSPAMMIYLDNQSSIGPDSQAGGSGKARGGLNENYGREVMELHTLGVDGGYTQADVTALSSILTGWGVDKPQAGGPFRFNPRRHEPGAKLWLGHTVPENGEQEGVDALRYLAAQPATAHHICFDLAQRFTADAPAPALVSQMEATWTATGGDIAAVLRTMAHAPEFLNRANYRNKMKSPLEFVASAMRATATDPTNPVALASAIGAMGEPLYRCQPPTGYPITGAPWMSSSALLARLNFAVALGNGQASGMRLQAPLLVASELLKAPGQAAGARIKPVALLRPGAADGKEQALRLLEVAILGQPASPGTRRVLEAQLADSTTGDATQMLDALAAAMLGSPEFQVH